MNRSRLAARTRVLMLAAVTASFSAFDAHACMSDPTLLERDLHVETKGADTLRAARLQDAMRALHIPSVSIALISNYGIGWAKAYGNATPDTLYQAGSLSKTVAAVAALRLVQDDELRLDEDVNRQLVSWRLPDEDIDADKAITLRRLLNMTAGIGVPGYEGYARGAPLPNAIEILNGEAPADSPPVRVDRAPGSIYAYSGGSYQIVQLMIEDKTKQSFADAVRRLVLEPVGMTSSVYTLTPALEAGDRVARGHEANGQEIPGGWRDMPERAAAGLWSTPSDFARLLISISNAYTARRPGVLRPAIAQSMLTKSDVGPYGLGVAVAGTGHDLVFMKRGQNVGYQAYMLMFPDTGDGIVIMTGSNNGTALETALIRRAAGVCRWPTLGTLMD